MVAQLRRKGDEAPSYGDSRKEFTLEVHHGGYFVGYGHLRTYVDDKVNYFDWIEVDTWSPLWFEDFVKELGHEWNLNLKIYWLLPEKTLADGLRVIASDHDTRVMAAVAAKIRTLIVYVDHEDKIGEVDWDDVVANPVVELPKVISPRKVEFVPRKAGEKLPVFYSKLKTREEDEGDVTESNDSEKDNFIDSDNEIVGGDEDLAEDNVTEWIKNKKSKGSRLRTFECSRPEQTVDDSESDEDVLDLPESDGEGEERFRLPSFREDDTVNSRFKVGHVFESMQKLRDAIAEYSIRNRVEIKLPRNDSTRLRAHCADKCPWNLYASFDSRLGSVLVKTYYGVHNCQKEWVLKRCTAEFPKCDILLNNNCEVFNKYILNARELPVLSMFEKIKSQLMTRHHNKQKEMVAEMQGEYCPKIRKKVSINAEWANKCYALPAGQGVFQVLVKDYQHIVDINAKSCDCRRWQLTGVPCSHAIACLRHERIAPESVLHACYSVHSFGTAYGFNIWPCKDKLDWEKVNGPQVMPPLYEKKVGRPPKSRRKQPHEVQGRNGPKLSKHGVVMHCRHCSEPNHNAGGCKLKKMGFSSEDAKKLVATTQAQLQLEAEQAAAAAASLHSTNPTEQADDTTEYLNQDIRIDTQELPLKNYLHKQVPACLAKCLKRKLEVLCNLSHMVHYLIVHLSKPTNQWQGLCHLPLVQRKAGQQLLRRELH